MFERTGPRVLAALLAAGVSTAAFAQQAAQQVTAPPPATTAIPAPQPGQTPVPVPVAPVQAPLPDLTPDQADQVRRLIVQGRIAQGLRYSTAEAEVLPADPQGLVRAALDYARAIHIGRLDTADFQEDWALRPAAWDPLPGFTQAVAGNRIPAWFAGLTPQYEGYDNLRKGLARYRRVEAAGGWSTIAAGPDMALGASGARVAALRARLAVEDGEVVATGDKFDAALKEAVVRAQRRYGLPPTGVVSTGTLAALNVPVSSRVRQIMANMERWRWMPKEMPVDRIQVNIAAAQVAVFEGDKPVMSMRGATGKPGGGETPMLASSIHSVVLNPPWNVPAGIAQRELFPKGSAYLARNGFKVIGTGAARRLQQQPSHSALGKYKFDFANPFAVYLHDTPGKGIFSSYDRLASHGCIRLERPGDLARLLLDGSTEWTPEAIDAALAKGETKRADLPKDVAVYLLYWTAYASQSGTMNFRGDPYGWDKTLATKIESRSAAQALAAR
ncbi:L,D-transpeptidase family protein [Sphingomonas sp. MG17]|uniref:L,D-transpeptidase family protein n=1 Tax=Sphingomonas tagetis TaxID=2949092 RepID=A0A9X2KKQ8_9SPHN|nr:L,D-transpeptidase family protein [Sphingomonas tagetis]MCP3730764.1 L,D-transpeptidase family protein [Sphingomonas tagetis]